MGFGALLFSVYKKIQKNKNKKLNSGKNLFLDVFFWKNPAHIEGAYRGLSNSASNRSFSE